MSYYQWKKRTIGIGIETQRGVAVKPIYWFPRTDYAVQPKMEVKNDEGNVGTLVSSIDSHVTKQWSEWSFWGKVYPNGIGYFLYCVLGKVNTVASGSNYKHTFSVEEVNTHPTFTLATHDPVADFEYPLTVVESIQLSAEVGGDYMVSVNTKGRKGQTPATPNTTNFVNEESFVATDIKVYIADNASGLDTADNICLQSFDVVINKNTEAIECLSLEDPKDYINKQITIEGGLEMYWEDNTYRDIAFNDIAKALRIEAIDKSILINGANPELTIDLPKVKINDWTDTVALGDTIKQSIKFTAHYSIADSKAINIELINTKSSY